MKDLTNHQLSYSDAIFIEKVINKLAYISIQTRRFISFAKNLPLIFKNKLQFVP